MSEEMSKEFFDWLDKCPVQWRLLTTDRESRDYTFINPDEDEEEEEQEQEFVEEIK